VVTNGPPSQLLKIDATYLASEFDAICVSSTVGSRKPERRIFEVAAQVCEVPLNGWMVGDSPHADVEGGRAAGLATIWMARGRDWDHSTFAPPDAEVATIVEAVSRFSITRTNNLLAFRSDRRMSIGFCWTTDCPFQR
jgi:FMN phosphatase YigB (HAD superfamily)